MNPTAKKLIEIALPIKEISAESVRDKSIRHGHISTLHLWWARRPLPVCRAVVFASLVPDPLDEHCPQAFRDATALLLGADNNYGDPYLPYTDIPFTSAADAMADTLRNRLLMFIGKFSDEFVANEKIGKSTSANKQLSDSSLIKWDNKNKEEIITKARQLIFVAHNAPKQPQATADDLLAEFDALYGAIQTAENTLYTTADRHLDSPDITTKKQVLDRAIEAFLDKMPNVFDPFAGGGAIPLEAARLGCRSYGNDINPVAHIIQKGSLEFPQKFGKPITYTKAAFLERYGEAEYKRLTDNKKDASLFADQKEIYIANRLAFDVEFYAKKLLANTEKEIGHLYPANDKGEKPIAYYWARVGTCSNPSCRAEVPLLKGFYLANTSNKQVHLFPIINGTKIDFEIRQGAYEEDKIPAWNERANLRCPCCGSFTDTKVLKKQFAEKKTTERLLVVIIDGGKGKEYRLPTDHELHILEEIPKAERPSEQMPQNDSMNLKIPFWGFKGFGDMFSPRQLYALQSLISQLQLLKQEVSAGESEYGKAVVTYLSFIVNKSADYNSSFCTWHPGREVIGHVFTKQAIPMVFDFPETYPFTESSGGIPNMIDWICRYIKSEENTFWTELKNASSGDKTQFPDKYLTAVVTDPPYYDAIAYADLSDFFYVWLKRSLGDIYPLNFATPQTPKSEECTALKHHHDNNKTTAKAHFEQKLKQIFDAIEHQTSDVVSIMFAHQSTEAWTTLCNSILGARMNITGSWAMDTEMANRALGLAGAVLASSVTVSCRPMQQQGYGEYREVKRAIERTVAIEVEKLYGLGFRGADLLTACFGQAVSEFGKYKKVEKADGSEVSVAELLELARESAFNALLKGFDGDDYTKFYIAWLQLYGLGENAFDDAAKFSRVGLTIDVSALFQHCILIKNGNKQSLATYAERVKANKKLGEPSDAILIDQAHAAMALYKGTDRKALLAYIAKVGASPESVFWRVLNSLKEVLPTGCDDHAQVSGLIANKEDLIRESKQINTNYTTPNLFGE